VEVTEHSVWDFATLVTEGSMIDGCRDQLLDLDKLKAFSSNQPAVLSTEDRSILEVRPLATSCTTYLLHCNQSWLSAPVWLMRCLQGDMCFHYRIVPACSRIGAVPLLRHPAGGAMSMLA
jgi:hypothetical protein